MNRRSYLRKALGLALGMAFLPWAAAQQAASGDDLPSAKAIFDRFVEVTGGAAAYESLTSQVSSGTLEITAAGLKGQLQSFTRPGLQRTVIELPGVGLIESGVKDGVAWENNPITGPQVLSGAMAAYTVANARPDAPLSWAEASSSAETTGIVDVNGEAAYRVLQTFSGGDPIASLFGVESGLLLKMEFAAVTPVGNIPIEQFYEEYMDFGRIRAASRFVVRQAGQQTVITLTSVETNVEIPDERFDLPEAVQALLK